MMIVDNGVTGYCDLGIGLFFTAKDSKMFEYQVSKCATVEDVTAEMLNHEAEAGWDLVQCVAIQGFYLRCIWRREKAMVKDVLELVEKMQPYREQPAHPVDTAGIGQRIRQRRLEMIPGGQAISVLAEEASVSTKCWIQLENDKLYPSHSTTYARIAAALNVSLDWLMTGVEEGAYITCTFTDAEMKVHDLELRKAWCEELWNGIEQHQKACDKPGHMALSRRWLARFIREMEVPAL